MYRGRTSRRLDPMAVLARISNWKSAMVAPNQVKESDCDYDSAVREI